MPLFAEGHDRRIIRLNLVAKAGFVMISRGRAEARPSADSRASEGNGTGRGPGESNRDIHQGRAIGTIKNVRKIRVGARSEGEPMSEITRRGFVKGAALAPLALTPFRSMARQAAPGDRFD